MPTQAKKYDESLVNHYEEELISHADTVFRFAFGLCLSLDTAHRVVKLTYQNAAGKLKSFSDIEGGAAVAWLLGECWRAYGELKANKGAEGTSAVTRALKPMAVEARAALLAVDVAGLTAAEAAKALGQSESELRAQLAAARKGLLASGIEI